MGVFPVDFAGDISPGTNTFSTKTLLSKDGTAQKVVGTSTLKVRPKYGPDCLVCATFARQRQEAVRPALLVQTHPPERAGTEREFFIDNLQVQIHLIILLIRWTGLVPWEFECSFPCSLTSTFLGLEQVQGSAGAPKSGCEWNASEQLDLWSCPKPVSF